MPAGDTTGPRGMGAGTGRGMGPCGAGLRRGLGFGHGRGMGRGMGWGRPFGGPVLDAPPNAAEENADLRRRTEALEAELDALKARLAQMDPRSE